MEAESVLITGTTSGIGRALLQHYVTSSARVVAVNRRRDTDLEMRFPSVRFEHVDVRSAEGVERLVERLAAEGALPHLLILNAGINRVDNDESFDLATYREVIETNLYGVLNFVAPLTKVAPTTSARHIIAVGSLAAVVGNPYGLGYHTSKRSLSAAFGVWSRMYAETDLIFQEIVLGPVRTPMYTMASAFPRWMVRMKDAFAASVDDTARAIAAFAKTRRRKLYYPRRALPLYGVMCLGQSLVPGFFQGRKTLAGNRRRERHRLPDEADRASSEEVSEVKSAWVNE